MAMNKKIWYWLIFALILIGVATACSDEIRQADFVVANVTIVDVESGKLLKQRDVFIKDGIIHKIGKHNADVSADSVINASGLYLIPGLWDFHVHFRGGDSLAGENRHLLNLYIANGVTTVRDAGGDITPDIMKWRQQIEAGKLTGPEIFTSGPKLDGMNPTWAGSIELNAVSEVPAAIDSLKKIGADYVKLYDSTIPADVYLAAVKQAKKEGLKVTGHMPFSVQFREALKAGLDASEHMYYVFKGTSPAEPEITKKVKNGDLGFAGALAEIIQTSDEAYAAQTYELMAEQHTGIVPTLYILDVLGGLATEEHNNDKYLNYIGPGIEKTYQRRVRSAKQRGDNGTNIYRDLQDRFSKMLVPMQEAGVTIYAGSDSGPFNSFVYPGVALHEELTWFVKAGLTPAEALRSATIHPASFFGQEDHMGQVKEGYEADMALLKGNPLEDINQTQNIHLVILNGKQILTEDMRQSMLEIESGR